MSDIDSIFRQYSVLGKERGDNECIQTIEHTKSPSITIKSIEFNNGQKIKFKSDDIVLLVGANNVGKSIVNF